MGDFAKPGDKVRFLDANGYDMDLKSAREQFTKGQVLTVAEARIGNWNSTYRFLSATGWFNTVMFEPVEDEAPVAESQPEIEILEKVSLTKDEVIDRAIATLKRNLTDTSFQGTSDEQMRAAMADVIAEVRVTALDSLLFDVEALDGARHLMQWLSFDRPTDKALLGALRGSAQAASRELHGR